MYVYRNGSAPTKPTPNNAHLLPRYPIAVDCWFPTGKETKPKIIQFKIKSNDGDIVTISQIKTLCCEHSFYFGSGILEYRCEIVCYNQKREVIIYFFPRELKWELSFIT